MNYKIVFGLILIAAVGMFAAACATKNNSVQAVANPSVVQPAITDNSAARAENSADKSFVPLVPDDAAAPTAVDVLISAEKAAPAPAFADGKWINSEPLSIEKLRGQVVRVNFWTFGCCARE